MKVLHVVPSLSPAWGGPVAVVAHLTRALEGLGVASAVFTTYGRRVGTEHVYLDSAEVRAFPTGLFAPVWTAYSSALHRSLVEEIEAYDLVHVHELWHYPGLAAARVALRAGRPYVVTIHGELDGWALRRKGFRKRLYMKLVQRRILVQASALHVMTTAEKEQVARLGLEHLARLVPNGVSVEDFEPSGADVAHSRPGGSVRVLFLGRIHPKKGLDILAASFGDIARKRSDVELVIAGPDEGGYRRRIEALLVSAGASGRASFTGLLSGRAKVEALASADIFVLPSYSEGFSMAVLEAMAAGLPVIISRQCNFPEVADAGAGIVIDADRQQLTDALNLLMDSPSLRREMGLRGRELVARHYSWESVARRIVHMYQDALGRARDHVPVEV